MKNALFYFFAVSFCLEEITGTEGIIADYEETARASRNVTETESGDVPSTTPKSNSTEIPQDDPIVENNPSVGVFPDGDDVKEDPIVTKYKLLSALLRKFRPLNLLRPFAVKVANIMDYLGHPNVGWTPGYFLQKLRDKFEHLVAVHQGDYPFPYRAAADSRK